MSNPSIRYDPRIAHRHSQRIRTHPNKLVNASRDKFIRILDDKIANIRKNRFMSRVFWKLSKKIVKSDFGDGSIIAICYLEFRNAAPKISRAYDTFGD